MGIEPTLFAWEAKVLPLNYTRVFPILEGRQTPWRIFVRSAGRKSENRLQGSKRHPKWGAFRSLPREAAQSRVLAHRAGAAFGHPC